MAVEPVDKKIRKDLQLHLEKTARELQAHDGWNTINIPEISEQELVQIAAHHGLENDQQTRHFCKFISLATNFASLSFKSRLQQLPELVNSLKNLIIKMEEEIKDFADLASYFYSVIHSFIKVVINTKHNMKMALPHLEESVVHMRIMCEALMPDSDSPLTFDDLLDVEIALNNMSYGIQNLVEHSKASKEESVKIDTTISSMKEKIESKIAVNENRISFANILPKIGATIGMVTGASSASALVESIAFGGSGVLILGGFSFPPIGAVLVASTIGALGIGSIILLITKLWEKHQFKALGYLRQILEKLNKLNNANLAFMEFMNKSEEEANKILNNIEFFKSNVKNGSKRYRKTNAGICFKAIQSTNDVVDTICKITEIDMSNWINERQELENYGLLENVI